MSVANGVNFLVLLCNESSTYFLLIRNIYPSNCLNECTEAPLCEYEKIRAENMMRNNQLLQRLGVNALASMVNNTRARSKDDSHEQSGSLYNPQDNEGSDQDEVSKVPSIVLANYLWFCNFINL